MGRITILVVVVCVLVIAGSLGLVLHLRMGTSLTVSILAGVTAAVAIGMAHMLAARGRDYRKFGSRIKDLMLSDNRHGQALVKVQNRMEELGKLEKRIAALETGIEEKVAALVDTHVVDSVDTLIDVRIDEVKNTLVSEMRMIETLVKQLAEGVKTTGDLSPAAATNGAATNGHGPPSGSPLSHMDDTEILSMVRQSIEENRVDLYLQPVVTLPQRKVRFYEALTRLRGNEGELILPADYIRVAEPAGIMPMIDNLLLFRCVQVVRQLTRRNRDVGMFCNISAHSLVDSEFFPQFVDFMEHNRSLAGSIFFEFKQSLINGIGPIEVESMSALANHGFSFSMDNVTSLDFDPNDLAERGFKYIKVPADLLLSDAEDNGAQIHPADLSDLLARNGISLVAEKIESEGTVVNLLDYDVGYGQGFLFSEPKPVRGDALQSGSGDDLVSKAG